MLVIVYKHCDFENYCDFENKHILILILSYQDSAVTYWVVTNLNVELENRCSLFDDKNPNDSNAVKIWVGWRKIVGPCLNISGVKIMFTAIGGLEYIKPCWTLRQNLLRLSLGLTKTLWLEIKQATSMCVLISICICMFYNTVIVYGILKWESLWNKDNLTVRFCYALPALVTDVIGNGSWTLHSIKNTNLQH